jgi:hypothetical protein
VVIPAIRKKSNGIRGLGITVQGSRFNGSRFFLVPKLQLGNKKKLTAQVAIF